jgi:hypothetical protein
MFAALLAIRNVSERLLVGNTPKKQTIRSANELSEA